MALLKVESFDVDSIFSQRWDSSSAVLFANAPPARTAQAGVFGNGNCWAHAALTAYDTFIFGGAFYIDSGVWTAVAKIFELLDGATTQIYLQVNADRTLTLCRGDGTTLASSSSSQVIAQATWVYIELKVVIDSTGGSYVLRVDGVEWFSASGVNTSNSGVSRADGMRIEAWRLSGTIQTCCWDDVYLCDDQGGRNDDFLGSVTVQNLLPSGAGSSSQWTPNTGANFECVDDAYVAGVNPTPDEDVTFVSTTSVNARDLYALNNLGASGNVLGVAVNIRARKDAIAVRQVTPVVRHAATDSNLAAVTLGESYAYAQQTLDTNPITAAIWTVADVNNLEIGVVLSG